MNHPLESPGLLSQSLLWKLQRAYFQSAGMSAWQTGRVPSYITSHPCLAEAYAQVFLAQLRELRRSEARRIFLIELGAGSGRFAYHLLRRLVPILERERLGPFTYIYTDLVAENMSNAAGHPFFAPWIEAGWIDFATFDAERPAPLHLHCSGQRLEPGNDQPPLLVIANYVFDGLACDAYAVESGSAIPLRFALHSDQVEADLGDPAILTRIGTGFARDHSAARAYGDGLDEVLQAHAATFSSTHVLFPFHAMRCLAFLQRLGGGRLLALVADKGVTDGLEMEGLELPVLVGHGSVSVAVDFLALSHFAERRGGGALLLARATNPLAFGVYWLGALAVDATRAAFELWFDQHNPLDQNQLRHAVMRGEPSIDQVFACLRNSRCDAETMMTLAPGLAEHLPKLSRGERRELVRLIEEVWGQYFPIGDPFDLASVLASLLFSLGEYQSALRYLNHSRALYGDAVETLFNQALCLFQMGELTACAQLLAVLRVRDPEYLPAQQLADALAIDRPAATADAAP